MPSSSVRTFTDPDEYASAMRQATVALTVMESGAFAAQLTRIDLHHLWMQRFSADLGWTSHIDYWGGQVTVAFHTRPGAIMTRNGLECEAASVALLSASQSYYFHSSGPAAYGTVSLPLDELALLGPAVGGQGLAPLKDFAIHIPPPPALARLRRLHAAAGDLAIDVPALLSHPEAARGLEQALTEAMIACLVGAAEEDRAAQRQHAAIMRRFHRLLEEHLDEPLYITELCKEVGASQRTLQVCCREHLGMGAKHYLLLRRMHLVRRALREGNPTETTVTEIAARYGFWQFGRLAGEYKALFGEAPSTTLARPV